MIRVFLLACFIFLSVKVFAECSDQPTNEVDWTNCNFVESLDLSGVSLANAQMSGVNLALANIEKSQIDETVIEDNVKIDALVQIGHNSIIKKSAQITAGTIICGRAKIGRNCWIAPNSVIDAACEIGDNSFVGTLSLVKTNFPKNSVIVGSPAKLLRKNVIK